LTIAVNSKDSTFSFLRFFCRCDWFLEAGIEIIDGIQTAMAQANSSLPSDFRVALVFRSSFQSTGNWLLFMPEAFKKYVTQQYT
jgi:hypothetical protein